MDVIKKISRRWKSILGYRVLKQVDNLTEVDEFGTLNEREALAWDKVDVVGMVIAILNWPAGYFSNDLKPIM
jgi:hypothetical protein